MCLHLFICTAQNRDSMRFERIRFGFCFGGSNFLIHLKEADINHAAPGYQDSISSVSARGALGLTVGFVIEWRLGSGFYLKLNPGIQFNNYVVYYNRLNGRTDLMSSQNSFLDLPVHLQYKFASKAYVPVVFAGSSFRLDYTRPASEPGRASFWSVDMGVAIEKKVGKLIVAPGIRYAHALSDVWINRRMEMPALIDHTRLHTICFTVTVKG